MKKLLAGGCGDSNGKPQCQWIYIQKDISTIESKKSRLTDLLIDGKIE